MGDHYKTLGVRRNAQQDEIKDQYRRLSKKYHPDKLHGDAEKFKKIANAYEILSDPERRKVYDLTGSDVTEAECKGKAGGILQQIFQLIVSQKGLAQIARTDMIAEIGLNIDKGMGELQKNIDVARKSRKEVGKILKRVKHKNKMNPISVMLRHEIQKHTETITRSKQEMKVGKIATKMLKEYGYDFDQEMKIGRQMFGMNYMPSSVVFTGTS